MRVEQRVGVDRGKRLRQLGAKVARRAYSMNDLGRHEREYKTVTEGAASQGDGLGDATVEEGNVSLGHMFGCCAALTFIAGIRRSRVSKSRFCYT